MENYRIDRKLKSGKDYPPQLITLIHYFNKKWEPSVKPEGNRGRRQRQKELKQIERIFNEFFFRQSKVVEFDRKHRDLAVVSASLAPGRPGLLTERKKDYWQAFLKEHGKDPREIINRCINKVNAKLKLTNPELLPRGGRYYLEPISVRFSVRSLQRNEWAAIDLWELLAKIIDGLDPSLYKQCPYCKQIFLSRQRKKFHSECRSKYFSEKYGKEGRNAERQKQYRLRKKKSSRTMK
jgi:hypothetical protein